jgi:DNA-damage-inducible protein J
MAHVVIATLRIEIMSNLSIRVEDNVKTQAEKVFSDVGMSMSTAVNIFLKQVIRCNGIPFPIVADPFYSAENQARLAIAKERMEKYGGTVHDLIETDNG